MSATMQRLLTRSEQTGFLARHPAVAARVAITKTAMLGGAYDVNYYDYAYLPWYVTFKFPGIIEPIGIQVDDASYGLVTIQPAPDGEIYFSGWTDHDLHTEIPTEGTGAYQPPPGPGPLDDLKWLLYAGLAVAVVGVAVSARSKRG